MALLLSSLFSYVNSPTGGSVFPPNLQLDWIRRKRGRKKRRKRTLLPLTSRSSQAGEEKEGTRGKKGVGRLSPLSNLQSLLKEAWEGRGGTQGEEEAEDDDLHYSLFFFYYADSALEGERERISSVKREKKKKGRGGKEIYHGGEICHSHYPQWAEFLGCEEEKGGERGRTDLRRGGGRAPASLAAFPSSSRGKIFPMRFSTRLLHLAWRRERGGGGDLLRKRKERKILIRLLQKGIS